jgi:hypothetical protein
MCTDAIDTASRNPTFSGMGLFNINCQKVSYVGKLFGNLIEIIKVFGKRGSGTASKVNHKWT